MESVPLRTILREWGRIGCIGFGGPPTHIALLRDLCVRRRRWLDPEDFEDAIAACNLLPGPASTQLAIYCAYRVRGRIGALLGGAAFIVPGLVLIVALAALFLESSPPRWVLGAAAGAGAAVAAVAVRAALGLVPGSWVRASSRARWCAYLAAGGIVAALAGPWVVLVILGCGAIELMPSVLRSLDSLAWVAFKVGALSYGGGFVIIPLMQADAVSNFHWMTSAQFLNAVALGQVTPGPVVQTVAVVGYAANGIGGALLAALIAFTPSFVFVLAGGPRFDRLRQNARARAFLNGAGPAAIGAILGIAVPLARALHETWQLGFLAAAAVAILLLRRGIVPTLLLAGAAGVIAALAGAPLPH
ncbi:MAG: chromate transporter [Gaiellaceae bacterium]